MRDETGVNADTATPWSVLEPIVPFLDIRKTDFVQGPVVVQLARCLDIVARVGKDMCLAAGDDDRAR